MKALSPDVSALLDKLYNLRGEDSVVLVEMDKQKNKAEETKARTTEEKKNLQEKIADLEKQHEELNDQGDKLIELLSGINRDDYATVLDRLRIDFDPQNLVEKLNRSLPRTIDSVVLDTKKAEEQLVKVEEEMNTAITTIDELGIRRDTALANQEKLNEYFDLALTGKINITRDSITSLLEQFNFTEEEQREAAKILMFPEDALFSYDEKIQAKEKSGKSISEVIAEAKNAEPVVTEAVKIVEEEPVDVSVSIDEEDNKDDDIVTLLKNNDIDYLDFTGQEIDYLNTNYDKNLIEKNINIIKKAGIATDIFVNHIGLMLDSDLDAKVGMLLNVGKEPIDIYLNPSILEKYSKEKLANAIGTLRTNGMDPKNVPLMAY
jgi:hypothetical protein